MRTISLNKNLSFGSFGFIKAYIITMRPYLLFVSGITGIAGMSFGLSEFSLSYLLLLSASFLSYGFGQALTDCFQIDTDSISSPYRPLTQGFVSKNQFLVVSFTGLLYCILVFTYFNRVNFIIGIFSGLGLTTYTIFKRKWWGGPFYNSWIVASLFTISFLSVRNNFQLLLSPDFLLVFISVFFGYANFVLSGYFKDINADRETGYFTLPVVYGRKLSAVVSDIFAVIAVVSASAAIFLILPGKIGFNNFLPLLYMIAGAAFSFNAQVKLHSVKSDEEAYRPIAMTVHSYILILSAIASANKPAWALILLFYYLGFRLILYLRPAKDQI